MPSNEYVKLQWADWSHSIEYGAFVAIVDAGLLYLRAQFDDEYGDEEPDPDTTDVSEWKDAKATLHAAKILIDQLTPRSAPDDLPF